MTPKIFDTEETLIFSLRIALGVKFVVEEEKSHCSQTRAPRALRHEATQRLWSLPRASSPLRSWAPWLMKVTFRPRVLAGLIRS